MDLFKDDRNGFTANLEKSHRTAPKLSIAKRKPPKNPSISYYTIQCCRSCVPCKSISHYHSNYSIFKNKLTCQDSSSITFLECLVPFFLTEDDSRQQHKQVPPGPVTLHYKDCNKARILFPPV